VGKDAEGCVKELAAAGTFLEIINDGDVVTDEYTILDEVLWWLENDGIIV
jgi:hypothetical protein